MESINYISQQSKWIQSLLIGWNSSNRRVGQFLKLKPGIFISEIDVKCQALAPEHMKW